MGEVLEVPVATPHVLLPLADTFQREQQNCLFLEQFLNQLLDVLHAGLRETDLVKGDAALFVDQEIMRNRLARIALAKDASAV